MKFELTQSKHLFRENEIEEYKNLGFEFKNYESELLYNYQYSLNNKKKIYIEINSLEELIKLSEKFGELIITKEQIEIYNDYRE